MQKAEFIVIGFKKIFQANQNLKNTCQCMLLFFVHLRKTIVFVNSNLHQLFFF